MTTKTTAFSQAIKYQTGPSPENKLAGALLDNAMREVLKRKDRTAIDFLTKPNALLQYWCDVAGINMPFVVRMANEELKK